MPLQLAIGGNKDLSLWCEDRGFTPDGGQKFWVINGHWAGVYRRGIVYVDEDGHKNSHTMKAKLLWRGYAPYATEDYNEAMQWLRLHLKKNPSLKSFFEGMEFNMNTKINFADAVQGLETDRHNERVTSLATAYTNVTDTIASLQKRLAEAEAYRTLLSEKGAAIENLSDEEFSELYNTHLRLG
jgi:hypothetical protein